MLEVIHMNENSNWEYANSEIDMTGPCRVKLYYSVGFSGARDNPLIGSCAALLHSGKSSFNQHFNQQGTHIRSLLCVQ